IHGCRVPDVLLSGDHKAIERWRLQQALGRTWLRRPALIEALRARQDDTGALPGQWDEQKETLLAEFIQQHKKP
ncbi:MAG TPA: hypothetical protein ENJ64_06845, partial [Thiotrichales bacterium]|nr:hypothetical protein [Thiotrichales bacterium]